jgi:hypothetical protein
VGISFNEDRREKALDWAISAHARIPQLHNAPIVIADQVIKTATAFEKYLEGAEEAK